MIWRTDKPTEKIIVAKLTEDFCHLKDGYAILRLVNEPYQHYSEDGEEIPYAAIEKWASLEEEKLPEGLEEAARLYAIPHFMKDIDVEHIKEYPYDSGLEAAFIARAKYQRKQDQQLIELAEDHAMLAGMNKMKEQMMEKAVGGRYMKDAGSVYVESWPLDIEPDSVKAGDGVRLIVIPEE